jgi:beta-barrel assembly-enhancing protease
MLCVEREKGRRDMDVYHGAVLVLVSVSLNAQQPDRVAEDRSNSYSLAAEAALGRQMASELRRRTTAVEDSSIEAYVNRLGSKLAMEMPAARFSFQFNVVADDPCEITHEPASLPGGYVFVPASLLVATHNEAEFAGMLAHAMEHVAVRQATRQATSGQVANSGTIPLIFMGSWAGSCSGQTLVPVGFLATQRNNELEVDGLAVHAMAGAGFDPTALVSYIKRVQPPQRGRFSPLPTLDERVTAMNSIIEQLPPSDYEETSSEFVAIREKAIPYTKRH